MRLLACLLPVLIAGCEPGGAGGSQDGSPALRIPEAEKRLEEYLEGAVFTQASSAPEELVTCETADTYPLLALANHRVLGSAMHGDTALVRAEVTSVATLEQDPERADGFVVRGGVRTDTLHWGLLRESPQGQWRICGYSREFVDFMVPRNLEDATVKWIPRDASWQTLTSAVDSLRRGGGAE
jgi:hypothetical protein